MITKMFRSVVILFLMTPLLVNSQTFIDWHDKTPMSDQPLKVGNGAFISKQDENLIISSGITVTKAINGKSSNQQTYIAEQLISADKQTSTMYIVNGNSVLTSDLTVEQGNRAYATTSNFHGATIVVGGIADTKASALTNIITWQGSTQKMVSYPLATLPKAAISPSSIIVNNILYVLTGSDADNEFYSLDLNNLLSAEGELVLNENDNKPYFNDNSWQTLPSLPLANKNRPYQNGIQLAVQNDGSGNNIFAIGGYNLSNSHLQDQELPLTNHWKYKIQDSIDNQGWQVLGQISLKKQVLKEKINSLTSFGQSHILAFTNEGNTLSFNAITNSWTQYLPTDSETENAHKHVSEKLTASSDTIYSLNRTNNSQDSLQLWQANLIQPEKDFGWVNMTVLVIYLICVVLVGLFFVFKNRNTDDYFRGGQSIPWWAAACSIYATMLSSLTYVALPAVVYQSNWLLLIGIWMIIAVAPVAIYVAMPFFRQIDATSAYEYLSKRFNMSVRLFASGLFTLFHIGRMGIVMALTALALSAVTPLSASDSVLIMGVLCLIYCTMGGIEAVIWTDTLQTIVLIIGAITCFVTIIIGLDGGLTEFISIGLLDDKFTMVNADFSLDSITTLSIWVIVIGGIGQNISSYTADQAVVQRYMVTKDPREASKSIWANAIIAAPGALLFFCIGTGLYAFYQLHPEKLDPTIQIDQIFPTFIATELPIGLAGLIVAGIFAAAQSTVSTSMNSIATTLVTDFIRPFNLVNTEKGYMSAARWLTFIMGALGTLAGLIFINPEIRSLMEAYFKVIGMFMGALGGLFVLGALTKKANSFGAIVGILVGVATMISAWKMGWANGYLYATIGIVSCLVVGYIASLLSQTSKTANKDLTGLTLYTMRSIETKS